MRRERREDRGRSRSRRELLDAFDALSRTREAYLSVDSGAEAQDVLRELELRLRSMDPRIRRSRRTSHGLYSFAKQVLGEEAYRTASAPFDERLEVLAEEVKRRYHQAKGRYEALVTAALPTPGPEREWRFHGWTHEGRFGAEREEARERARLDVAIARSLGLEARCVEAGGRYVPSGVPSGSLVGAGFRVFVGVQHEADLSILDRRATRVWDEWSRRLDEVTAMTRIQGRDEAFAAYLREKEAFLASGD